MGYSVLDPSAIAAIPPLMLASIPAAIPPSGVIPNFVDRPTIVPLILGLSYAFLVLASVCFVIRIWTKAFIVKKWQWDDCKLHRLMQHRK